jgi:four helix bundle protein
MDAEELKKRTKKVAASIVRFVETLSRGMANDVMGRQLIRSATSVAANYRAVCRSRSRADFVNKLSIVVEEADETLFWLEMLVETGKTLETDISDLKSEMNELLRIFSASRMTARTNAKSHNQ